MEAKSILSSTFGPSNSGALIFVIASSFVLDSVTPFSLLVVLSSAAGVAFDFSSFFFIFCFFFSSSSHYLFLSFSFLYSYFLFFFF